jgi:hypothetical protein
MEREIKESWEGQIHDCVLLQILFSQMPLHIKLAIKLETTKLPIKHQVTL